ncbi:hypothetical protein E5D35_22405, partial [Shigella sonnei]
MSVGSVQWSACHRPTRTRSPPVYATATSTPSGHAPAAIPVFPSGGPAGHRGTGSPPVVRRA